jgi:hypothetical protein
MVHLSDAPWLKAKARLEPPQHWLPSDSPKYGRLAAEAACAQASLVMLPLEPMSKVGSVRTWDCQSVKQPT